MRFPAMGADARHCGAKGTTTPGSMEIKTAPF